MQDLVDKVRAVKVGEVFSIGDIIRLKAFNGDEIVGFVRKIHEDNIKLSHEDPKNRSNSCYANSLTRGDRWYNFSDFDEYEVIITKKETVSL